MPAKLDLKKVLGVFTPDIVQKYCDFDSSGAYLLEARQLDRVCSIVKLINAEYLQRYDKEGINCACANIEKYITETVFTRENQQMIIEKESNQINLSQENVQGIQGEIPDHEDL